MTTTPDCIGPYEVIRPVAQGGMAEVYEVRDPSSGERMALKLLIETRSSIKRFNREFEALTRLNHPSIVRVFRYGFHLRQPWITMELLDGEPLQSRVKRFGEPGDPDRTDEVVRIGYFLAGALQYIHDRGLVHRDLKSANVQVLPDGRVKVIDFGTAHLAHPLERITQDGDFVGTFSYAAPEQIVGQPVDHRADLYSLGVLLYRLSTGRRPFKASDPQKVAQMHLRQVARPLREVVPELPEPLERLVAWLMEKKKRDRPQSAEEVARALEQIAGRPMALPGHGLALADQRCVGRAVEHRELWAQLSQRPGPVGCLVIGGDAPERSRFAAQMGQDAARRGWRGVVLPRLEDPLRSLAGAWRMIAQTTPDARAAEVLQLLGDVRTSARAALAVSCEALAPVVGGLLASSDKPVLLVLQELQRFDADAVRAVEQLAEAAQTVRAPLVIAATLPEGHAQAADTLVRRLTDPVMVELRPLDVRETALAAAELLHRRPPPPEAARQIHAESAGRPTLIASVVREMVERGELIVRSDDGNRVEWTARRAARPEPTAELQADLDERLGRLPLSGRRVLEILAVSGGWAPLRLLAVGLGWDEPSARILVLDLVERGLARWAPAPVPTAFVPPRAAAKVARETGDTVHAVDPILLDLVDRAMAPARRRVIQSLIVDALPLDPPSPAAIRTLLAVGRSELALRLGVQCATAQLEQGAAAEALELLDLLKSSAAHPGLESASRADFHLLYGRCVRASRPMDPGSIRALHAADALVTDPEGKARVQLAYAEVAGAIGHQGNYRKHLAQAWELVAERPGSLLAAEVALMIAWNRVQEGDFTQGSTWFERARGLADLVGSKSIEARARVGEAHLRTARGDLAEAERILDGVLRMRIDDPVSRWEALAERAHVLRREGRFSEALEPVEHAVAEARNGVAPRALMRLLQAQAVLELDLCRLGEAQECIDEFQAGIARGERLQLQLTGRLLQGRVQLASGQLGLAQYQLREVVDQAEVAGLALLAEEARGCLAETRWQLGDMRESLDLFRQATVRLVEIGDVCALADVQVSRARCVGGREDPQKTFRVVQPLLERQEFRVLYLESLLAEHRWHLAKSNEAQAKRALQEVQSVFNGVAARQSRIEQAALRVHPWMQEIKRAI